MADAPDVFSFAQYRRYLDAWFAWLKTTRPRLSHRWIAKRLGTTDSAMFANLVSGKRNLTGTRVEGWIELLELDGDAADYFRALVAFEDAPDPATATRAWAQLAEIRARRADPAIGPDSFELLAAWYVPVVRELVAFADFVEDPAAIAARLDPPITPAEAARALDIALRLGFLVRDAAGRLRHSEPTARTPHEVAGLASWPFHRDSAVLNARALEHLRSGERPGYERETLFLAHVTAIPEARLAAFRAEVIELFFKMATEADAQATSPADRVMVLSLGLVPAAR